MDHESGALEHRQLLVFVAMVGSEGPIEYGDGEVLGGERACWRPSGEPMKPCASCGKRHAQLKEERLREQLVWVGC